MFQICLSGTNLNILIRLHSESAKYYINVTNKVNKYEKPRPNLELRMQTNCCISTYYALLLAYIMQ